MSATDTPFDRLKRVLRVRDDKDVAEALGMSPAAYSDRKRRGAFPRDKMLALQATRPDLGIETIYVLTGTTQLERAQEAAAHAMPPRLREAIPRFQDKVLRADPLEVKLINSFRRCAPGDKKRVVDFAARLAKP